MRGAFGAADLASRRGRRRPAPAYTTHGNGACSLNIRIFSSNRSVPWLCSRNSQRLGVVGRERGRSLLLLQILLVRVRGLGVDGFRRALSWLCWLMGIGPEG